MYLDDLSSDAPAGTGLAAYRYTVEAFRTYLSRLRPGGTLAIALQTRTPPRESLKLFATAIEVLGEDGADARLVLLRGWRSALLLVRNDAWPQETLDRLRTQAGVRGFDLAYLPGMQAGDVEHRR